MYSYLSLFLVAAVGQIVLGLHYNTPYPVFTVFPLLTALIEIIVLSLS